MKDPRVAQLIMELRLAGVTDHAVLQALETVPREAFVGGELAPSAWDNRALPIDCGQTISQPLIVGLMTQALAVGRGMKVLEIGLGSGYQAAVLARLCRRVYSVERHRPLQVEAERRLQALGISNVTTLYGDGWRGWPEQAPFDRVMVTAAAAELPQALVDQMTDPGVMVVPIGEQHADQWLYKVVKADGRVTTEKLAPVRFVPMVQGLAPSAGR